MASPTWRRWSIGPSFDAHLCGGARIGLYDERLAAYNSRFGLTGNWSARVLERLAGPESMAGRDRLREILERLGLPSR